MHYHFNVIVHHPLFWAYSFCLVTNTSLPHQDGCTHYHGPTLIDLLDAGANIEDFSFRFQIRKDVQEFQKVVQKVQVSVGKSICCIPCHFLFCLCCCYGIPFGVAGSEFPDLGWDIANFFLKEMVKNECWMIGFELSPHPRIPRPRWVGGPPSVVSQMKPGCRHIGAKKEPNCPKIQIQNPKSEMPIVDGCLVFWGHGYFCKLISLILVIFINR